MSRVEVSRLELVSLLRQRLEVADPVVAGACTEDVRTGQCRERRVAARAAAADRQPAAVGSALLDHRERSGHAVLDVHDSPLAVETFAVAAAEARAAPVVDVEDREAPAGPVVELEAERRGSASRSGRRA